MAHSPPGAPLPHTVSTPFPVAGGTTEQRKRRKRTAHATTVRRINAKARDRQEAWLDGEPHKVEWVDGAPRRDVKAESFTKELEELYDDLRAERKGVDPGSHVRTSQAVARWQSGDMR